MMGDGGNTTFGGAVVTAGKGTKINGTIIVGKPTDYEIVNGEMGSQLSELTVQTHLV